MGVVEKYHTNEICAYGWNPSNGFLSISQSCYYYKDNHNHNNDDDQVSVTKRDAVVSPMVRLVVQKESISSSIFSYYKCHQHCHYQHYHCCDSCQMSQPTRTASVWIDSSFPKYESNTILREYYLSSSMRVVAVGSGG